MDVNFKFSDVDSFTNHSALMKSTKQDEEMSNQGQSESTNQKTVGMEDEEGGDDFFTLGKSIGNKKFANTAV